MGNCVIVRLASGFLKYACFDEDSKQLYYKCLYSDVYYIPDSKPNDGIFYSKACKNDPHVYQACGFGTQITNSEVICGGYICEEGNLGGHHQYLPCVGEECSSDYRDCSSPMKDIKCNGKCEDSFFCQDEVDCNGFRYGVACTFFFSDDNYNYEIVPAYLVCSIRGQCIDESDQKDCDVTETTEHSCTHYYSEMDGYTRIVPLLNYTRCSTVDLSFNFPYCLNYLDQTNCSDIDRVGGYCNVQGLLTSISIYMVCFEVDPDSEKPIELCDDNLQNECRSDLSKDCTIHKHRMCDGSKDCFDGSDEVHDICWTIEKQLNFTCVRRFNLKYGNIPFPTAWIMDGTIDCMSGEDEDSNKWQFCRGKFQQIKMENQDCQDAFLCPGSDERYVPFEKLCDGVESCGNGFETEVCIISRDFPFINKSVHYKDSIRDVCQSDTCEIKEFTGTWGVSEVFGVKTTTKFLVPSYKADCTDLYGEYYLLLSCLNLCSETDITCPLTGHGPLMYDSCPGQFPDRTYTIANNSFLVFLDQSDNGRYHQQYYQCDNGKCVEYKQVCDLIDDCGDMSDELICRNHMICEDTLNSSKHQFVSLKQRCDGIYDCFDLSDECNDECGREILENGVLKILCGVMGILAMLFNIFTVVRGVTSAMRCETENKLTSKMLMSLIGLGDFVIGFYLVILSFYDSIIMGKDFCKFQAEWLTGTTCLTLGVISTLGSQISLFTMTVLSVIRMYGLVFKAMRIPGPVNKKSIVRVISFGMATTTAALAIAVIPLIPSLEDYFVQGMYYDPSYKVFIGFPNKDRHIKVLQAYHDKNITRNTSISWQMSWRDISKKVDAMFSRDYGNLTRTPIHFYGNDGLCLYKYFVRSDDARRSRQTVENGTDPASYRGDPVVWTILALNFFCFIIITCCYIVINVQTKRSSQRSGQQDNPERLKGERSIQNKIMIIIATDFLCWVPFIAISSLHSLDIIDASTWYATFAMTVLPLNSVINPLVYDKEIGEFIARSFGRFKTCFLSLDNLNAFRGLLSKSGVQQEPEVIPVEVIREN